MIVTAQPPPRNGIQETNAPLAIKGQGKDYAFLLAENFEWLLTEDEEALLLDE